MAELPPLAPSQRIVEMTKEQAEGVLAEIEKQIAANPKDVELYMSKALLLLDLKEYLTAADVFQFLHDHGVDKPSTLNNLALALHKGGDYRRARLCYEEALREHPKDTKIAEYATIMANIALLYEEIDMYDEAKLYFENALKLSPEDQTLKFNRSDMLLAMGELEEGWEGFKYRYNKHMNVDPSIFAFPVWDGEPLAGKHALIWTEQGLGDEVLMASLIDEAIAACGEVTLLVSKRFIDVALRVWGKRANVAIRKKGLDKDTIKEYIPGLKNEIDFQLSLGELGRIFRPGLEYFPEPKKYITSIRSKTMAMKRKYKRHFGHKKKIVGIAWASNNGLFGDHKSIPLGYFHPIVDRSDVGFVSVQYRFNKPTLDAFNAQCGTNIYYDEEIAPEYKHIEDTVAQLDALDLLITTSNSAAHIAGALGKEVFLILPKGRGRLWFWFRGVTKCMWYPNVKIFNAEDFNEERWIKPVSEVVLALNDWLKNTP